jgi:site-specific DNA-adenine methylase
MKNKEKKFLVALKEKSRLITGNSSNLKILSTQNFYKQKLIISSTSQKTISSASQKRGNRTFTLVGHSGLTSWGTQT